MGTMEGQARLDVGDIDILCIKGTYHVKMHIWGDRRKYMCNVNKNIISLISPLTHVFVGHKANIQPILVR
ncbi:hypothetical protein GHYDROH2_31820 [Geobacter hydrogenophilus]|uniref:Uncharacterized protein n=1 Tax=Geobacter hydrogenophilus TaxID=40983 RepID=A0A9W6G376_9BACT|nr:hypothetical protein GHYDROH2_31820 [Geobacter hydrogenophilus]